jgi:hypothetical protein
LDEPQTTAKNNTGALLTLPKSASAQLPSRGMVMTKGMLNGLRFRVVVEPDGQGSHWFQLDKKVCEAADFTIGDTVNVDIEPTKEWPEPAVASDVKKALAADPQAQAAWQDITPMARWDWLNWLESVKLSETRQARPQKLCSMLKSGKRRPCCFNRTLMMSPKTAELL